MPEISYSLSSTQDLQTVYRVIEDELKIIGQCSVTRKGNLSLTPKPKYNSFLTKFEPIEGIIRQTRQGEYEIYLTFSTRATMTCWALWWCGAILVPYYFARKNFAEEIHKALHLAEQQLE